MSIDIRLSVSLLKMDKDAPYVEFQNAPSSVPLPRVSNIQRQNVTKLHSGVTQTPASGKWKFDRNQGLNKCNTQNPTEIEQCPQMILKSYPDQRGQVVQAHTQPIQTQQFYSNTVPTTGYYQPLQGSNLAITQLNYQPGGYQQCGPMQPSTSTTNFMYGPPNNENRRGKNEIPHRYLSQSGTSQYGLNHPVGKGRNIEPNSTCGNATVENVPDQVQGNFEYTLHPEQLVKSLCGDRRHVSPFPKMNNVPMRSLTCGSPSTWSGGSFLQRKQFEHNEFMKVLTHGCLQAEAIATRNQHRPCFKNIKNICSRTRIDITKPKSTAANIHSQGIPWATKDFIFAYIRLINCWHILNGYLENDEGSLGNIDGALTAEFIDKYYRWQNESKDMMMLLNSLFVKLDKGITVQNAEIFAQFNNMAINSTPAPPFIDVGNPNTSIFKPPPSELPPDPTDCGQNNSPPNLTEKIIEETNQDESYQDESFTKEDTRMPPNIPGILRVKKQIFADSKETNQFGRVTERKGYIQPGTYRQPDSAVNQETSNLPDQSDLVPDSWETLACSSSMTDLEVNNNVLESHISPDNIWESAIKTAGSFVKRMVNNENDSIRTMEEASMRYMQTTNPEDIKPRITEQYMDNNNVRENVSQIGSNRKNVIVTQVFKKRIDDRDMNKGPRHKNGYKSQTKYLSRKHVHKTEGSISETPKRTFGLTPIIINKFEKIIHALWLLPFSKYITFEVNADYLLDYYKHIEKPMFLCNIVNGLKFHKYKHINQVVHDLRTIVWNGELYIQKHIDIWFEQCLQEFSSELELQLTDKFPNINFNSVTGDPSQTPTCDLDSST